MSDELSSETTAEYELMNETEYLEEILGIKYLPLELVMPITLAYMAILTAGIIGNLATCIVIYRQPYMQTPTNYYLFNLALSDLLLLLWGKSSVHVARYPRDCRG